MVARPGPRGVEARRRSRTLRRHDARPEGEPQGGRRRIHRSDAGAHGAARSRPARSIDVLDAHSLERRRICVDCAVLQNGVSLLKILAARNAAHEPVRESR
jgi:hypothetical protein